MAQQNYGRREFLNLLCRAGAAASALPKEIASYINPFNASPSEAAVSKNSIATETSGLERKLNKEAKKLAIAVRGEIFKLDSSRSTQSYNNSYTAFKKLAEESEEKYTQTKDDSYRALQLISIMYAGNSAIEASARVGDNKKIYIENALQAYKTALSLREGLDRIKPKKPISRVSFDGPKDYINVADEQLIRYRLGQTYRKFLKVIPNGKRKEHIVKAIENEDKLIPLMPDNDRKYAALRRLNDFKNELARASSK